MSVAALAPDRPAVGLAGRLALALAALALVGGLVAVALWTLAAALPAPVAPHPFGTGLREAAPAASRIGIVLIAWQSTFFTALREALASLKAGGGGLAALLGIGLAYGILHAAGPGHGKALISAYLVSSERAMWRGLAVSAAAALVQALVAIALVTAVFGLVGGTAATLGRTASAVELAGFALVVALGLVLVWRKAGKLALLVSGSAGPGRDLACACSHVDPAEAGRTVGQMAGIALAAGIRPCTGAIVVLTLARANGIFPAGIAAAFAMALGTAATTSAIALLSVHAKRAALRMASGRGRGPLVAAAGLELAAAAFVVAIGVALLAGVWDGSSS